MIRSLVDRHGLVHGINRPGSLRARLIAQDPAEPVDPTETTLAVVLAESADPIVQGASFSYTVDVENTGATDGTHLRVLVQLDGQLAFVSAAGTGWTFGVSGEYVTCTRATLAPGAAPTITVTVTAPAMDPEDDDITVTTSVSADARNVDNIVVDSETTTITFTNPMAGVTQDAGSGKFCPADAGEWDITLAAAGVVSGGPSSLWLGQEASGDFNDAIGSNDLTAIGPPDYQQTVGGWARKGWGYASESGVILGRTANSVTGSVLALCYFTTGAPVSPRGIIFCRYYTLSVNSTPVLELARYPATEEGQGANNPTSTVRPLIVKIDVTAMTAKFYTDQEKVTNGAAWVPANSELDFGGTINGVPPNLKFLYNAQFLGSAAEISDADVKSILQTLGWTVAW